MRLLNAFRAVDYAKSLNGLSIVFAVTLALLILLRDSFYNLHPTLTLLYVFSPYWFLPVPGLLVVALALRARSAVLAELFAVLLFLVHFHLPGKLMSVVLDATAAETLVVANLNLGPGQAQPEQIVAALQISGADLIGVEELTAPSARQIEADLKSIYPFQVMSPDDQSTGLLSRYPILQAEWIQVTPAARAFLHAVVMVAEQSVHVLVVHPMPPLVTFLPGTLLPTGLDSARQQEHMLLTAEYAASLANAPLLLVGDLNMVAESPAYARITELFSDAHVAAGSGMGFTFPQDLTLGSQRIPGPFVRLDYLFHSKEMAAISSQVLCLPGSDHCLVVAELVVE